MPRVQSRVPPAHVMVPFPPGVLHPFLLLQPESRPDLRLIQPVGDLPVRIGHDSPLRHRALWQDLPNGVLEVVRQRRVIRVRDEDVRVPETRVEAGFEVVEGWDKFGEVGLAYKEDNRGVFAAFQLREGGVATAAE